MGNDVIYSEVCDRFGGRRLGRCSAKNTVVDRELAGRHYCGEGSEEEGGEEEHEREYAPSGGQDTSGFMLWPRA